MGEGLEEGEGKGGWYIYTDGNRDESEGNVEDYVEVVENEPEHTTRQMLDDLDEIERDEVERSKMVVKSSRSPSVEKAIKPFPAYKGIVTYIASHAQGLPVITLSLHLRAIRRRLRPTEDLHPAWFIGETRESVHRRGPASRGLLRLASGFPCRYQTRVDSSLYIKPADPWPLYS